MRFLTSRRAGFVLLASLGLGAGLLAVHARAVSPRPVQVRVTERDFRISAPKHVRSGNLVVSVANKGPVDHELIIVRAATGRLPVRPDGLTVDEDKLSALTRIALEPGPPGSVRTFRVRLVPGRYVLFCNMSGHFMAGMHTTLVVR